MIDSVDIWIAIYFFLAIGCGWILCTIFYIVVPPFNFPRSIPTVPFYVSFMGAYTKMDQEQVYDTFLREKLEKFGAVKIYFASRWNILVTKPEYLLQIFKNENIYTKSGNQHKIPNSVLSTYTGDNIISAHGDIWKLYRKVISPSVQFPNTEPITKNSNLVIELLKDEIKTKGKTLNVTEILQKYTLQNVGESILGVDFDVLRTGQEPQQNLLHNSINYIKQQIFRPFYMNFPFFDNFPIPSRMKSRDEVRKFRSYFSDLITQLCIEDDEHKNYGANRLLEALNSGVLDKTQFTDNAIILMVAGHENPLLLILSLLFTISKNQKVQSRLREELNSGKMELPYFNSVIYETLRLYPPIGQIINRLTSRPTMLGTILIPKGTYVGYNNFATGRDRGVWGEDANEFKPERWGNSMQEIQEKYAQAKRNAELPAFHGRKRACLGEKFALLEVKAVVSKIVQNFTTSLDPNWEAKLTPAGPISPLNLSVCFEMITGESISQSRCFDFPEK